MEPSATHQKAASLSTDNTANKTTISEIDLAFVCDVQCLRDAAGSANKFNADAQTIVNVINGYYQQYQVVYKLQPNTFITTSSNPWSDTTRDHVTLTNNFQRWASVNLRNEHNNGILFTGTDQGGISYAFLSHMCKSDNFRYGMHDYLYNLSIQQKANIVTHELGHLWGAQHISPANSAHIMNASIFDGQLTWKDSTRTVIENAVTRYESCFRDAGFVDSYCGVVTNVGLAGDDYITKVAVNNTTIKEDNARIAPRADYTDTVINMSTSSSSNITISAQRTFNDSVIAIFIDWNQDNDFDDAGERVISRRGTGPYTFTITPPSTAKSGNTRMRIRLAFDGNNSYGANGESLSPCGETEFDGGETEDYTVNVTTDNTTPNPTVPNACLTEGAKRDSGMVSDDPVCIRDGSRTNSIHYFWVYVPNGTSSININMDHGTGNADLYYNASSWATESNHSHRSTQSTNKESLTINNPRGNSYHYFSVVGIRSGASIEVKLR